MASGENFNLEVQCVEIPGARRVGHTGIYRNAQFKDALLGFDPTAPNTLHSIFEEGKRPCATLKFEAVRDAGDRPFLGTRARDKASGKLGEYGWLTYAEVRAHVIQVAGGLGRLGKELGMSRQWSVGLFSINRLEWNISDIAASSLGMITVALFDTYGQDALEFVIGHAEVPVVVASMSHIHRLLSAAPRLTHLKVVISMDPLLADGPGTSGHLLRSWAASCGIRLMDYSELKALGAAHPTPPSPPAPEDVYTICYTSGTTGQPKGAVCTHLNYAVTVRSLGVALRRTSSNENRSISYLPAAHCFERITFYLIVYLRGQVGYYSGNILGLMDDVVSLKPTVMVSVPRLLNRIYDQVTKRTLYGQGVGPALFRIALRSKLDAYRSGGGVRHAVWDAAVFSRVRALFGGRLEVLITGSAPIDPKVLEFLRVTLACDVLNGYGATETCAAACIGLPGDTAAGPVGPPVGCLEFKLVDVPEMGYTSDDTPNPRGEICVRGTNVFKGYYREDHLTTEVLDGEGWYHTGDIARLSPQNLPVIVDRKKNLFKLSQGEYVAPERVEGAYAAHPLVQSMFVFGDPLRSYLVGICVPDPDTFPPWARAKSTVAGGLTPQQEFEALCKDPKVISAFLDELASQGASANLSGFEKVRAIHLEPTPFSIDNGFITPTFKLKRHELTRHYKPTLEALYRKPSEVKANRL
ncbi:medium-chain fatty acid-CoA ligase faa2 [Massospora cicadina]|nr:medium-chain fatty acid-CoA ligase faa2 [Massospora cicadina]